LTLERHDARKMASEEREKASGEKKKKNDEKCEIRSFLGFRRVHHEQRGSRKSPSKERGNPGRNKKKPELRRILSEKCGISHRQKKAPSEKGKRTMLEGKGPEKKKPIGKKKGVLGGKLSKEPSSTVSSLEVKGEE